MTRKNIIIIIAIVILFIGASIAIYFFANNDEELSVTGTVLVTGDGYIILSTNQEDYLIKEIQNHYEVGDTVMVTYEKKSLNEDSNPKEITALKEELKKENITQNIDNDHDDSSYQESNDTVTTGGNNDSKLDNSTDSSNQNQNNNASISNDPEIKEDDPVEGDNPSSNHGNPTDSDVAKTADEEVLTYINTLQSNTEKGFTDQLKSGFITIVDFLFYDGEIAGHTFNELTTKAKLEVLKAALWVDDKIDSVFPGYKETISNGASKVYTGVKNLIVSTYLDITSSICDANSSLCEQAKEDFQSLKDSFGLTWDFLKGLASSGLDKLQNWYEVWSGK